MCIRDRDASEIEVRLVATWIDKEYIQQFMYETFKTPPYLRDVIEVKYVPYTAESVSYTHLDVYKRQGLYRPAPGNRQHGRAASQAV